MTENRPAWRGTPLVLAMLCGIAAYNDSFRGPFIFDDIDAILNNPQVNRALTDSGRAAPTTLSGRPVLWASFAADYAVGGMRVETYHITNLLIHLSCGAILFGIVRRNLSSAFWGGRFVKSGDWHAGAATAIWLVHPLNTEAVTYTVQRGESLTGLFYLLVIYCLIRGWKCAALGACALGMGTKEAMATAPLVALIYDRTFISGSFAAALRRRSWLYTGLAATWIIPAVAVVEGSRRASVGGIAPLDYARTQLGVIGHYIALFFWPRNLVLDYYDWPIAHSLGWAETLVALAILISVVLLWRRPWLGFLGLAFHHPGSILQRAADIHGNRGGASDVFADGRAGRTRGRGRMADVVAKSARRLDRRNSGDDFVGGGFPRALLCATRNISRGDLGG